MSSLWRGMASDPWRKLLALVLALALWLYLNSQLTTRNSLSLRLVAADARDVAVRHTGTQRLTLRVPLHELRVVRWENGATGEPISGVEVLIVGPTGPVARLANQSELFVEPSAEELHSVADAWVFGVERLFASEPELRPLVRSMTPRSVRVWLDRLEQQKVRLTPGMVARPEPEKLGAAHERLVFDETTFYPEQATFSGTRQELERLSRLDPQEKLFDLSLEAPPAAGTEWKTVLLLRPAWQMLRLVDPELQARVPLRTRFLPFEIEVPVLLDTSALEAGSDALAAQILCEPTVCKLTLSAAHQLEAELSRMSEAQLRAWAQQNARLIVVAPAGASLASPQTVLPSLVILSSAYREGRDYVVRTPPPVVLSRKKA